ncbi:hypothetical protein JJB07_13065 [Tumebacillus sp. ITR2]|uniref:Uncharacterized protein n=1 Tax=Tumebacillus amylolyticus TaxID=2801339 RepID=A0ABS1JBF7_9BACL|nr:hypothetical protein [Tumebacillus amylolyticus]MBL0387570.1 hypothetical protein [Tumebacillus amylolyticus]
MDGAEYLMIFTTNQIDEPLVDNPNTHYRPKSESCKKYVDQTSDLKIKKKYAGKWDFYFPYEMEFAVSPSLRELFEAEGIQGMSYRPIYTNRVAIGGHERNASGS